MLRIILLGILTCMQAWAYQCYKTNCTDSRMGSGMYYSNATSLTADYQNVGGFLSGYVGTYWKWFYIGGELSAGLGYASGKTSLPHLGDSKKFNDMDIFYSQTIHIGANLGSSNEPILLSFTMPMEVKSFGSYERVHDSLYLEVYFGLNVFGKKALTKNLFFEYQAGYAYNFARRYKGASYEKPLFIYDRRDFFSNSHRLTGSLGVIWRHDGNIDLQGEKSSKMPDYYARLVATYWHLDSLPMGMVSYPSNSDVRIMLEAGVSFGLMI